MAAIGIASDRDTDLRRTARKTNSPLDELEDPRALALPDWNALTTLAEALAARSADRYQGWRDAVIFEACTAARIGEVSGCPVRDINTEEWIWTVCRQTTP